MILKNPSSYIWSYYHTDHVMCEQVFILLRCRVVKMSAPPPQEQVPSSPPPAYYEPKPPGHPPHNVPPQTEYHPQPPRHPPQQVKFTIEQLSHLYHIIIHILGTYLGRGIKHSTQWPLLSHRVFCFNTTLLQHIKSPQLHYELWNIQLTKVVYIFDE